MFENEKKFLLLVAMPVVDESQKQEIVRLFQENINFDYVYRQLILNKISNLAFQNLRETRILGVFQSFIEEIWRMFLLPVH